ncbi:calmodulin-like [Liolophura sinensis]|uniref:calmodulin-like n=1 Tax=Liolophura sinensis TaxID=3198878 RepID=UPI00315899CD
MNGDPPFKQAARRATLYTMAAELSDEHISEFKRAFELFDEDGDDVITAWELDCILKSQFGEQSPSERELKNLTREQQCPESGMIRYDDYLDLMGRKLKDREKEMEIREAFRVFDKDGNGFVSAAEIKQAMVRLGESVNDEDVDTMIREADEDGDGHISYHEFAKLMTST